MFLYILVSLFSCINSSDSLQADANSLPLSSSNSSSVVSIKQADALNSNFPKVIESFSKDLIFYFGKDTGEHFPYHSVRHHECFDTHIMLSEGTSRLRAFDGECLYLVPRENEHILNSYNFKKRISTELSHYQSQIQSIKLSKLYTNRLYAFQSRKSFMQEGKQSHEIALISTANGEIIKKSGLKLIDVRYNGNHFKMVETNNLKNTIIYCRYAGKLNAWHFNASDFELIKVLPYHFVQTCKTNASGDLVAINSQNEVCICSSDDLENKLYSFQTGVMTPQSMRFIHDIYLLITAHNNNYVPVIFKRPDAQYDATISRDFLSLFQQFKSKSNVSSVIKNDKEPNAAIYIVDLASKNSIFEKHLSLQYGFRVIKPCFHADGSLKINQFALRDSGCFDGTWYLLSID